jgi:hypothetical protein
LFSLPINLSAGSHPLFPFLHLTLPQLVTTLPLPPTYSSPVD